MWLRVFCAEEAEVLPSWLAAVLAEHGHLVDPHFRGDDLGWTSGELRFREPITPIILDRYLVQEDELRHELNTFAALLESMDFSPNAPELMRKVIQTQQLIVLRRPVDHSDEARLEAILDCVCREIAQQRDGIIQIEGQGWFAADGTLLLQEY